MRLSLCLERHLFSFKEQAAFPHVSQGDKEREAL